MKVLSMALVFVAGVSSAQAATSACWATHVLVSEKLEILNRIQQKIAPLYDLGATEIFTGRRKPNWNDYNHLVLLIETLQDPANQMTSSIERKTLASQNQELTERLRAALAEQISTLAGKAAYNRFLDYQMAYFRQLQKANELLKFELFPEPDLSELKNDHQLIQDAETLIRRLEGVTAKTFPLSGHQNFDEYKKYAAQYSELAARALKLTEDELVVAMHRPESGRFWIPFAGFQNQRITGSSKGSMFGDTSAPNNRDHAETKMSGIADKLAWYFPKSPRFKPTYAEARPAANVHDIKPNAGAGQYGSDLWIMKTKNIEKRATWTQMDSLTLAYQSYSSDIRTNAFPWSYRALMIPFSLYSLKQDMKFTPWSKPTDFKLDISMSGSYYFEVQIWGPLTIDDVQAFHFMQNPPDKKFYDLLVSKGIEVWDERSWPAKPYDGSESR